MHDEEMDRFIQEQKHRLENERKLLENNPASAVSDYILKDVEPKKIVKNTKMTQPTVCLSYVQ